MNQFSRNRQVPTGNPIANALVVIVGALAIGLSFILGVVAFIALGAVLLVLGAIIGIRIWWMNRRMSRTRARQTSEQPSGVIEGEYRVVVEERDSDSRDKK